VEEVEKMRTELLSVKPLVSANEPEIGQAKPPYLRLLQEGAVDVCLRHVTVNPAHTDSGVSEAAAQTVVFHEAHYCTPARAQSEQIAVDARRNLE
jgi:hypothetical protein